MQSKFPLTVSIPEAGRKVAGLSRSAAYRAADLGDIPTIRLGPKLRRVPLAWMRKKLADASRKRPR
jgi:hypothetical protein